MATDAAPVLVTSPNSGIPTYLTLNVDPKIIEILTAPMKAAQIVGTEVKKGDWTTKTAQFTVAEQTGQVSSYDDYSNEGVANANVNFPQRQAYLYQVITRYGQLEMESMGLAAVDWANQLNMASVLTLNKYQNKSYFFGIQGLENYGLLNDPKLPASIAPTTESGNITWGSDKSALGVLADVASLFSNLQARADGLVDLSTPMVLAMSPVSEAQGFTKTNNFNVNVFDLVKKNYPNLRVETAPEYATSAGNLVQLIVPSLEGQRTADCAFTEKLRAHNLVVGLSNYMQKKSQGTFGTIIYRPFLISSMLGV